MRGAALLLLLGGCRCLQADSVVVAEATGLRFEQRRWSSGGVSGVAWCVRIDRQRADVGVEMPDARSHLPDFLPARPGVWAAVNGGFYEDGPLGLVRVAGVDRAPYSERGGSGVLIVDDGGVRVIPKADWPVPARHALQSVDRLVVDGASVVKPRPDAQRAARAAVALDNDHVWLVVAVGDASVRPADDGWQVVDPYGAGMTLGEFAGWLVSDLGATSALNLDGGLSVELVVDLGERAWTVHGVGGTVNAVVVGVR